jgi:hypothetical protein
MARVLENANPEAKEIVRSKNSMLALELLLATQSGAVYRITQMELAYNGRRDVESKKSTIAKERKNV